MSPGAQVACWGAAVIVTVALNYRQKGDPDAFGLSMLLLMIWVMGRITWAVWEPPHSQALYPITDYLAGCVCFWAWQSRPRGWKLLLALSFLAQLVAHATFWVSPVIFSTGGVNQNAYTATLNAIFALQLITLGWRGAKDGVLAGCARAWLRGRPGLGHRSGA